QGFGARGYLHFFGFASGCGAKVEKIIKNEKLSIETPCFAIAGRRVRTVFAGFLLSSHVDKPEPI
ncbi:MAG: hypothetical protein K2I13_01615, partial [Alistipes sp.]|nr:hypothetical protein [Alistipes sp.]